MISKLDSLSVSSLRKLDNEVNKFYDRKHDMHKAALLIRCYTQHALRPYIDSEINIIRHLIKVLFINKGIEFIDLPSTFRDNNVISYIASYFKKGKRKVQGVSQSQTAALSRPQEEEETNKSKQAQTEQTHEKH